MPVEITRVERGIYHVALAGKIMLDEIFASQASGLEQASADGDKRFIQIITVDRSTDMPFDIRHTGDVIKRNSAMETFVVGATLHIRFLVRILGTLFGLGRVQYFNTFDEALAEARKRISALPEA